MTKAGQYTLESWMIANGKGGDHFYSEKADKHLTAIASGHGRKIRTERLTVITNKHDIQVAYRITKVTLL